SKTVLDFINSGYSRSYFRTSVTSVNAQADGTLFALPGGAVKLAAGVSFRREGYRQALYVLHALDVPTSTLTGPYQRNLAAGFAELRAPLVGEANAVPGIRRLEISAAVRAERYDDVGTTVNPKFGLIWSPVDDLNVRFTYGRAFRAPALAEEFTASQIGATFLSGANGTVLSLYTVGGNPNLKPERARTLTAGLDYTPRRLPGLKLSATWFDTNFTNRIEQPVLLNLGTALTDPQFSSFVTHIDPTKASDVALVQALLNDPRYTSPGAYPANAFGAIVDAGFVNSAGLRVSGVDISAHYDFVAGDNRFDLDASASHLYRYERQTTPLSPALSILDTPGNPTDLRARGTATWTRDAFSLTGALNYVAGYHDTTGKPIEPWTTLDLQLQWRSPATAGALHGVTVTASVRNLLDSDPPFYNAPAPQAVGYDAANADAIGRFASLQLTKRW
ncbi:MAG: TonB-dependent receptor, partial [Proteobacteria bacterium]|nr:TonB-dependent receptor [Pseudomonadota bacterium]